MMLRWLSEIIRPARKCGRLGHKAKRRFRHIIRHPRPEEEGYRVLYVEAMERQSMCRRCGDSLGEWEVVESHGLTGITMDGGSFAELAKHGHITL